MESKKECVYVKDNTIVIYKLGELRKDSKVIALNQWNTGKYFIEIEYKFSDFNKQIDLTIKNKRVDYEGVYFLNKDVVYLLRQCGFIVPWECLE